MSPRDAHALVGHDIGIGAARSYPMSGLPPICTGQQTGTGKTIGTPPSAPAEPLTRAQGDRIIELLELLTRQLSRLR